jgi:hypothetical protein
LNVAQAGAFTAKISLMAGVVGNGKCGVKGHLTCGDPTQQGTVVKITFTRPR